MRLSWRSNDVTRLQRPGHAWLLASSGGRLTDEQLAQRVSVRVVEHLMVEAGDDV